jgi:hypothetical protein
MIPATKRSVTPLMPWEVVSHNVRRLYGLAGVTEGAE